MDAEKIGKFIAEMRKRRDLTQRALAIEIHVTNKAVSKWENGNGIPDIGTIIPLSEALGVTANELLTGEIIDTKIDKDTAEKLAYLRYLITTKYFNKTVRRIISYFLIFSISITLIYYFIISYNQMKVYQMHFESTNFRMNQGFFMESYVKHTLELGNIEYIGSESIDENQIYSKIYIKNPDNDETKIIYEGYYEPIYIYEQDGYNEIFNEKYIDLLEDNFYIELSYETSEGIEYNENIKIEVDLKLANDKIFNLNEDVIMLDTSDNVEKYRQTLEFHHILENDGYKKSSEDLDGNIIGNNNIDHVVFVKEYDNLKAKVVKRDNQIQIRIIDEYNIDFMLSFINYQNSIKIYNNEITLVDINTNKISEFNHDDQNIQKSVEIVRHLFEILNLEETK